MNKAIKRMELSAVRSRTGIIRAPLRVHERLRVDDRVSINNEFMKKAEKNTKK